MIVVALHGGLGNQLFQYAAARHLAHLHQTDLFFDLSFFDQQDTSRVAARTYELANFFIHGDAASAGNLYLFFPLKAPSLALRVYYRLLRKLHKALIVREHSFLYDSQILNTSSKYVYLKGYFQSERYFVSAAEIIRNDFKFRNAAGTLNEELLDAIQQSASVSVHVRRGDFLNISEHGVLPLSYYDQAMNYLEEQIKDPVFYVFSDDVDWVKENLRSDASVVYVDHNRGKDSFQDLRLMQACQHNIIANSSFSWWGAWLNTFQNKIVIAPAQWYNDPQLNAQSKDLIPETWIRM